MVVEDQFARWAGTGVGAIERDVLGTDDPRRIAEAFESFCVRQLAAPPAGGLFYAASAGCVLGVHLESGNDVVIKAYQCRWGVSLLAAVQALEDRVSRGGIPWPLSSSSSDRDSGGTFEPRCRRDLASRSWHASRWLRRCQKGVGRRSCPSNRSVHRGPGCCPTYRVTAWLTR